MHRKLCKRYNEPGHAHFFTFSCYRRLSLLTRERSCLWFAAALEKAGQKHDVACWAYVLMPEHVHLIVCPRRRDYNISAWLSSLKQGVARPAMQFCRLQAPDFLKTLQDRQPNGKTAFRFWQRGGGVDLNLWSDAKIWDKIDYLHGNPARRGLCVNPQEWFWSSYRDFAGLGPGPIALDWRDLPADQRQ